jgi:enoyl-CoA hydratase
MAERIASRGPLAVAAVKRLIVRGADESQVAAISMEAAEFGAIFATADQKEGMGAFLAKRPAQFTGA